MVEASVLIAPDKFKGSLTSREVAAAVASGIEDVAGASIRVDCLPLADGGDGSVAAAVAAGYQPVDVTVPGPTGRPVRAVIAEREGTVIVEVANTCGLQLLPGGRREPLCATTRGVGAAVRHALALGPQRIVLALGGSASTDAGMGMLAEFGVVDSDRLCTPPEAWDWDSVTPLGLQTPAALRGVDLVLATDVTNPLLGSQGAARVFGPQKGADPGLVEELEDRLARLVRRVAVHRPDAVALAEQPGAGSAGGLGFAGLLLGGRVVSGADFFLDLLDFDSQVVGRDLVITGEGRLDSQSLAGKLPTVVARRARGVPVELVVGRSELSEPLGNHGIRAVHDLSRLTSADTSSDPLLTQELLRATGQAVAGRFTADGALPRPAGPPPGPA